MTVRQMASPPSPEPAGRFPMMSAGRWVSLLCLIVFAVLSVLVQLRWLFEFDLAVAHAAYRVDSPVLAVISQGLSVAFSGECSLIYAGVLCLLLWRCGLGFWALAPLAFLPVVALEVVLKYLIYQPSLPSDFYRDIDYPLATVALRGSFPSGHAARGAFFIGYLAAFWRRQGGAARWLAPIICGLAGLIIGLSRIYLGVHWFSDVVAGSLLGAPVGYEVAAWIAERLARPRRLDGPISQQQESG